MSKVVHVNSIEQFNKFISQPHRLIVVDYSAAWCSPCKRIAPIYDQISIEYTRKRVDFLKVDVDELSAIAQKYRVASMPTFQFFKNGNMLTEFSGADPNRLRNILATNL